MTMKLKPVVYTTNYYKRGAQNSTQQLFLLKALQVTQDPNKLRQMIGVKTVAEVYRTLDKMSLRKEYHAALAKKGIDFDFLVGGLKTIATDAERDGDKLKALQVLLKSLGLDKYETDASAGGSWEEALTRGIEGTKTTEVALAPIGDYEVKEPPMPESARRLREEEAKLAEDIYG